MRSFKSNENIHKKEGGSYYVVSATKACASSQKSNQIKNYITKKYYFHMYSFVFGLLSNDPEKKKREREKIPPPKKKTTTTTRKKKKKKKQ